jgi:hypothetical protein
MSGPGIGIPRLQELDFLLTTHSAAAAGKTFEDIRIALIDHMAAARAQDAGTGNNATFQLARDKTFRYVSNTADSLKELMRIGMLNPAALPSEPRGAPHYSKATFSVTEAGERWAGLVETNRAAAYDELANRLWQVHPHFVGYLKAVTGRGLVVPLARFNDTPEPRTRERFVDLLVERASSVVAHGDAGWTATAEEIRSAVRDYIAARLAFAASRQRPEPYPRNQDFINACEEALVKFAFVKTGTNIDYITHEVLRRWMRVLGLGNFSYYVPGPDALRLWPTADIAVLGSGIAIARRVGDDYRDQAIALLGEAYEQVRKSDRMASSWVPIYRVRAAVCWRLRVSDALFNRALAEFLRGERGDSEPFAANVDPTQYGSVPPSERGLQLETKRGLQTYYSMSLIPRNERKAV